MEQVAHHRLVVEVAVGVVPLEQVARHQLVVEVAVAVAAPSSERVVCHRAVVVGVVAAVGRSFGCLLARSGL